MLLAVPVLYPWAHPSWTDARPEVVETVRGFYLQRWFFTLRTAVCVLGMAAAAVVMLMT